jgi:hypothetical protein
MLTGGLLALAVLLGGGLTGCAGSGSGTADTAATADGPQVPSALTESAPAGQPTGDVEEEPAPDPDGPTLPPGDPGAATVTRAPDVEPTARTAVPADAVLDAGTVAGVLGGRWTAAAAPGDSCAAPRPTGAVATRSVGYASGARRLVETVATHADPAAAESAVRAVSARLRACGWTPGEDLLLGEASASFTRTTAAGPQRAVVLAAEGVSVTLVGPAAGSGDADRWPGLADVALGTSCPAAPDGCH